MIMATVLINALHAPLEDRKETFNGIGVNGVVVSIHVAPKAVNGRAVFAEMLAEFLILLGIISHHTRLTVNVGLNDGQQGFQFQVVNNDAASAASIAVDQREHFILVGWAARIFVGLRLFLKVVSNKGFVYLNYATIGTKGIKSTILHGLTNAVSHEPCRFKGNSKGAVKLVRTNALLAGGDQEDSLKPEAQRDMAFLENGADLHGKRLAAVLALPQADAGSLALKLVVAVYHATVRAYRAMWPKAGFNEGIGGFFVMKVWCGKYGFAHDFAPVLKQV